MSKRGISSIQPIEAKDANKCAYSYISNGITLSVEIGDKSWNVVDLVLLEGKIVLRRARSLDPDLFHTDEDGMIITCN